MAAPAKLTDADVKQIRRRIARGEHQTDLAKEFGVNRKTIRRRLTALERAEADHAQRLDDKRRRRQAAREKRNLIAREGAGVPPPRLESKRSTRDSSVRGLRAQHPSFEWLDRRKNLSGRAFAKASGLIRVRYAGSARWIERKDVERFFDEGWVLDE